MTVNSLRLELATLQKLVFEQSCEIRCANCLKIFEPSNFLQHIQIANCVPVIDAAAFKEKKRQQQRPLSINQIKTRVTECARTQNSLFEITVQIDLLDRTAEFTVEKNYSEVVGILKIISKSHCVQTPDCDLMLRECLDEGTKSFRQEERDNRFCLQFQKLLNQVLQAQDRQIDSCSKMLKSFLSVTHLTCLEIEQQS